jgi:GNAT superfamily N-acetyltransferase
LSLGIPHDPEDGAGAFRVRDARPGDVVSIVRFNCQLAEETESKRLDPETVALGVTAALDDPDRLRYWVAETVATGEIVGQVAVTREWTDWRNGWLWWFQSVYVHADWRGRGVFRALHGHIRDAARQAGDVVGLRLYVEQANDRARSTYLALGMSHGGYEVYEELWPERFGGNRRPKDHD